MLEGRGIYWCDEVCWDRVPTVAVADLNGDLVGCLDLHAGAVDQMIVPLDWHVILDPATAGELIDGGVVSLSERHAEVVKSIAPIRPLDLKSQTRPFMKLPGQTASNGLWKSCFGFGVVAEGGVNVV